jgi:ribosomal protein S26
LGLHANVASELKKIVYALEWRRVGAPTLRYSKHYSTLRHSEALLSSAIFQNITQLYTIQTHFSTLRYCINSVLFKNITQLCIIEKHYSTLRYCINSALFKDTKTLRPGGPGRHLFVSLFSRHTRTLLLYFFGKKGGKKEKNIPVDNGMQS